jgi:hypothetical protein
VVSSFVGSDFGKNGGTNVTGSQVELERMNDTVTRLRLDANFTF